MYIYCLGLQNLQNRLDNSNLDPREVKKAKEGLVSQSSRLLLFVNSLEEIVWYKLTKCQK